MALALACAGAGSAVLRCRKADGAACPPAIYLIACSDSPAQDEGHIKWPSLRAELCCLRRKGAYTRLWSMGGCDFRISRTPHAKCRWGNRAFSAHIEWIASVMRGPRPWWAGSRHCHVFSRHLMRGRHSFIFGGSIPIYAFHVAPCFRGAPVTACNVENRCR